MRSKKSYELIANLGPESPKIELNSSGLNTRKNKVLSSQDTNEFHQLLEIIESARPEDYVRVRDSAMQSDR
jgi:hypothetical protein